MIAADAVDWDRVEQGERDKAYFHTMRKGSHPRAQRQAAWRAAENYENYRHSLRRQMRPIAPTWQWSDVDDSTPAGWTYPGCRTLVRAEVDHYFPGALDVLGEWPSPYRLVAGHCDELRLSVPTGVQCSGHCAVWLPKLRAWRFYSTAVRQRPHKAPDRDVRVYDEADFTPWVALDAGTLK
jgi:hypothetical protein